MKTYRLSFPLDRAKLSIAADSGAKDRAEGRSEDFRVACVDFVGVFPANWESRASASGADKREADEYDPMLGIMHLGA